MGYRPKYTCTVPCKPHTLQSTKHIATSTAGPPPQPCLFILTHFPQWRLHVCQVHLAEYAKPQCRPNHIFSALLLNVYFLPTYWVLPSLPPCFSGLVASHTHLTYTCRDMNHQGFTRGVHLTWIGMV